MNARLFAWRQAILPRHIALAALCALSLVYVASFRYDLYGIDEGAARALLLDWSLGSHMLNPIALLGFPDMRALLFAPLNFQWIGDLTAARVLLMFLTLGTGLMLYRWAEKQLSAESALFATGLWLIAPLTIAQVDSLGAGNILILACILCYWSSGFYRASTHSMPGNYFILLLLIALATSMHPAGLGMAIGLVWHESWIHRPAQRKRIALFIGLALMLFFVLVSRTGWPALELFINPMPALARVLEADLADVPSFGLGLLVLALLFLALLAGVRRMRKDLFSCMLLGGIIAGAICANAAWAELVLTYILFEGIHGLVLLNNRMGSHSAIRQRGIVGICILILMLGFMLVDKQRIMFNRADGMHRVDRLIARLGALTAGMKDQVMVASQWPGRTMLATRRSALPLPPVRKNDPDKFLSQMHGVTFLMYDYNDPAMKPMNRQVAELSNRIQTEALLPDGVILRLPDK